MIDFVASLAGGESFRRK